MGDRSISQTGIDRKRDVLAPKTGISGEQGGCWLQVCLDPGVPGSVRAAFWHWVIVETWVGWRGLIFSPP